MQSFFIYNTAGYARASKDDTDSSTIENQLGLIRDHVKSMQDIKIVQEYSDNGFSGVDFVRPSFAEMMRQIEAGKINCIIVKDLSRLGRNYIEVGELMDEIFPRLNVRLVSINDNYDSNNPRTDSDEIIIPFKNLMNEQYLRDSSIKIRSNLSVKRKNGDFVAPRSPYGYTRDDTDKHRLVIDEHASRIVQDIFRMKIEGMSQQKIAERLNEVGEPSPSEYRGKQGVNFNTPFQKNERALWSAVAIGRILHNPIYIGTLVQGKETTPNYKVKKRMVKPENEWCVTEEAHAAIIKKSDFEIVNGLLGQDTRTPPKQNSVFPLSGIMFCADCGNNIVRKKVDKYFYYVCATSKAGKGCSSHNILTNVLEAAVMEAITKQIAAVLDLEKCLEYLSHLPYQQDALQRITVQITERETEIKDCERYKRSVYEDYKKGEISKEDFKAFSKDYTERIEELSQAVMVLRQELELLASDKNSAHKWIEHFKRFRNVGELSRQLVANLITRIDVYEKKKISITFRYKDKFLMLETLLNNCFQKAKEGCH